MKKASLCGWSWLIALSVSILGCGDAADPGFPRSAALEDIRETKRTFVDQNRVTPANGDFQGQAARVLETHLWYAEGPLARPACRGSRCALVILAHGFGGNPARFDAIGQRLAAAGYIVAAPTFPLTNEAAPGGFSQGALDTLSQPGDISFVIDALLQANRDRNDPLFERIDPERMGAMGHSLGGTTVIGATRVECCTDTRLDATAYVEPGASFVETLFGAPYDRQGPPTLTFQGEVEFPISPEASRIFQASIDAPRILVEMVGGNHINMIERFGAEPDPLLDQAARMMIAFFDAYVADSPQELTRAFEALRRQGHRVLLDAPPS